MRSRDPLLEAAGVDGIEGDLDLPGDAFVSRWLRPCRLRRPSRATRGDRLARSTHAKPDRRARRSSPHGAHRQTRGKARRNVTTATGVSFHERHLWRLRRRTRRRAARAESADRPGTAAARCRACARRLGRDEQRGDRHPARTGNICRRAPAARAAAARYACAFAGRGRRPHQHIPPTIWPLSW